MTAEYIKITPKIENKEKGPRRRIMCHAMIAYYKNDEGENIIVLMDGLPVEIWETPAQIDKQLKQFLLNRRA